MECSTTSQTTRDEVTFAIQFREKSRDVVGDVLRKNKGAEMSKFPHARMKPLQKGRQEGEPGGPWEGDLIGFFFFACAAFWGSNVLFVDK